MDTTFSDSWLLVYIRLIGVQPEINDWFLASYVDAVDW